MTRTVLVTGAAGCVGARVTDQLLARGDRVVATDRPGSAFPAPKGAAGGRLTVIPGDLTDPSLPPKLVQGVDAVIHTAAVVDISLSLAALRPINVDAVARLHDAATEAGVATFVHFSTGSIYAPQERPIREDDPLLVQNDYGTSKVMSEDLLRARYGSGPVVNILRPSLIFGPRGRVLINLFAALPPIVREVTRVVPNVTGGPRCNYVHADDVARAAIHLVDHPQEHGTTFNIANDDPVSAGDMITETLRAFGLRVVGPPIPLPFGLLRVARPLIDRELVFAALNRAIGFLWNGLRRRYDLGTDFQPSIPREMLDFVTESFIFDNARLKATGFTLTHPDFATPWADTIRWFRENRWIPAEKNATPSPTEDTAAAA